MHRENRIIRGRQYRKGRMWKWGGKTLQLRGESLSRHVHCLFFYNYNRRAGEVPVRYLKNGVILYLLWRPKPTCPSEQQEKKNRATWVLVKTSCKEEDWKRCVRANVNAFPIFLLRNWYAFFFSCYHSPVSHMGMMWCSVFRARIMEHDKNVISVSRLLMLD